MKVTRKRREDYKARTHLIHGSFITGKWDYDHHVNPPMSDEERDRRGIHPTGIRLSLGLEDYHDIIHDLGEALSRC